MVFNPVQFALFLVGKLALPRRGIRLDRGGRYGRNGSGGGVGLPRLGGLGAPALFKVVGGVAHHDGHASFAFEGDGRIAYRVGNYDYYAEKKRRVVPARVASADAWVRKPTEATPPPAGEANLVLPDLGQVTMMGINGRTLLMGGLLVSVLGLLFGFATYSQLRDLPVHQCMKGR